MQPVCTTIRSADGPPMSACDAYPWLPTTADGIAQYYDMCDEIDRLRACVRMMIEIHGVPAGDDVAAFYATSRDFSAPSAHIRVSADVPELQRLTQQTSTLTSRLMEPEPEASDDAWDAVERNVGWRARFVAPLALRQAALMYDRDGHLGPQARALCDLYRKPMDVG
jgi:hypothetical protein